MYPMYDQINVNEYVKNRIQAKDAVNR
jgi:hypothetical protein